MRPVARAVVTVFVLLPVAVGVAAFLLIAKALTGSWTWGVIAFAVFGLLYASSVLLMRRWAVRHPDQVDASMSAWGRAIAFGSGGWDPSQKRLPKDR
jgi:O-antigen/teichoic acid export membrane protein